MQGTRNNSIRRIAYADLNISLVFLAEHPRCLLRVLSFQLPMSSRYACKNDSIRNNCDVIVPSHDCH